MGYRDILTRFNKGGEPEQYIARVPKLPRVWPGLGVSLVCTVWALLELLSGRENWSDSLPIAMLLAFCYWCFCIYRLHVAAKYIDSSNRFDPIVAAIATMALTWLCFWLAVAGMVLAAAGQPIFTGVCYLASLAFLLLNISWQAIWAWQITALLKRNIDSRLPIWLPSITLALSCVTSVFFTPLGYLANFCIALLLSLRFKKLIESREKDSLLESVSKPVSKVCQSCSRENDYRSKFCIGCGNAIAHGVIDAVLVESARRAVSSKADVFAKNAFRLFDLFSSASSGDIVKAGQAFARSAKLGAKRKIVNDLEILPAIDREPQLLQAAADRLRSSRIRIFERLFWFHNSFSPDTGDDQSWLSRHDEALRKVVDVVILDPELGDTAAWIDALKNWALVCESTEYWSCFRGLEEAGAFEPAANGNEYGQLRKRAVLEVLEILTRAAKAAALVKNVAVAQRAVLILKTLDLDIQDWDFEFEICGYLEESIVASCEEIVKTLNSKLHAEAVRADVDFVSNVEICARMQSSLEENVLPRLDLLVKILGLDSSFTKSARETVAECIDDLASGYALIENYEIAIELLTKALNLAKGTLLQAKMAERLETMETNAEGAKVFKDIEFLKGQPPTGNIFGIGLYPVVNPFRPVERDAVVGSYFATYMLFVFWVVPLMPLGRYRMITAPSGQKVFIGKGKLRVFDRFHQLVGLSLVMWCFFGMHSTSQTTSKTPAMAKGSQGSPRADVASTAEQGQEADAAGSQTDSESIVDANEAAYDHQTADSSDPIVGTPPPPTRAPDLSPAPIHVPPTSTLSAASISERRELDKSIASGRKEMASLKASVASGRSKLAALKNELEASKKLISQYEKQLASSDEDAARVSYESDLEKHNALVNSFNSQRASISADIARYNSLVDDDSRLVDRFNKLGQHKDGND